MSKLLLTWYALCFAWRPLIFKGLSRKKKFCTKCSSSNYFRKQHFLDYLTSLLPPSTFFIFPLKSLSSLLIMLVCQNVVWHRCQRFWIIKKKMFFHFYQILAVPFFDVSDFCHIKYFQFREIFGEQQYTKPAKLRFVIIAILFLSKFCFSQLFYHCFGMRFCSKTGIFILSRRKIFLCIVYRYQCQDRLHCSQDKSWFRETKCVKIILRHFQHCCRQALEAVNRRCSSTKKVLSKIFKIWRKIAVLKSFFIKVTGRTN